MLFDIGLNEYWIYDNGDKYKYYVTNDGNTLELTETEYQVACNTYRLNLISKKL